MINFIKKLPFYRRYTTNQFKNWWAKRKLDWRAENQKGWNHPHRYMLTAVLKTLQWRTLFEFGCGAGANLIHFTKQFKDIQLGGIDINPEAIAEAQKALTGAFLKVGSVENVMGSDDLTQVALSDMTLIYIGPRKIKKALDEMARIATQYVVLCELHSVSWWKRMKLRIFSGHNAYNYKRLLEKKGFYDISIYPIPKELWADDDNAPFRHIIVARVPL